MGELKVKYFPMGKMLVEHFTKPSKGAAFRKFRSEIQGIPEDTPGIDLFWDRPEDTFIPIPQERVERSYVNMDISINES